MSIKVDPFSYIGFIFVHRIQVSILVDEEKKVQRGKILPVNGFSISYKADYAVGFKERLSTKVENIYSTDFSVGEHECGDSSNMYSSSAI